MGQQRVADPARPILAGGGVSVPSHTENGIAGAVGTDVASYLATHDSKTLLRFVMCGSVDDGKSTLSGRLLYEAQALFVDQLAKVEADSKAVGTQGDDLDFALL